MHGQDEPRASRLQSLGNKPGETLIVTHARNQGHFSAEIQRDHPYLSYTCPEIFAATVEYELAESRKMGKMNRLWDGESLSEQRGASPPFLGAVLAGSTSGV
jgi:hypothetical protein